MTNWDIGTDNLVRVRGLRDPITEIYINDATVAGVLEDSDGDAVSGGTVTFAYRNASNGDYDGILQDTAALTENANYTLGLTITATVSGTVFKRTIRMTLKAKYSVGG